MKALAFFAVLLAASSPVVSQSGSAESEIKHVLFRQVDAWNRGDVAEFVSAYASDATFVGKEIAHGRDRLLARYRKTYPTAQAMGQLTFSALDVRLVTPDVALVTGEWHIERSGADSHHIGGLFSLVFQHRENAWQIVLDHTS